MNRAEALREIERRRQPYTTVGVLQRVRVTNPFDYISELEGWLADLLTEPKLEPARCEECDELATHCVYCGDPVKCSCGDPATVCGGCTVLP